MPPAGSVPLTGPVPPAGPGLPAEVGAAVAARFPGARVRRVEPLGRARLSTAARLVLADGRTVVAKWPAGSARVRRAARLSGAYEREALFYRSLAAGCPVRVPRAYAVSGEVLLLADVAGRPGDTLTASVDDVAAILRAVAPLHSRPAPVLPVDPRVERYALARIARAVTTGRLRGPAARVARRLTHGPPTAGPGPAGTRDGPGTVGGAGAGAGGAVWVHGDLHADQAVFPAAGPPVLVDWQLTRPGHAGMDTARLLTLSLPPELRREHETDLLAGYAAARGVDPATCRAEHRAGLAWTAFVNLTAYLAGAEGSFQDELFERIAAAT